MYKRIITYNFESDETRDSFVELLLDLGFEEQPDQSTYAQRRRNPDSLVGLYNAITEWSDDKELSEGDSVQIYYHWHDAHNNWWIRRHDMNYSANHRDLR